MDKQALKVFYSYSHVDELYLNALKNHLTMFKRNGLISEWYDRKIIAGLDFNSEIDANINSSDLILLLISPDFIASEYCYGIEMNRAMERHRHGEAIVVPIIIRPIDWFDAPFGTLQALPTDAQPVSSWNNQDEAWLNVATGLKGSIEHINKIKYSKESNKNLKSVLDLLKKEVELISDEKLEYTGIPTGFIDIDDLLDGIHDSDMIVVAGYPQMGKSDFVLNIVEHITLEENLPALFFTLKIPAYRVIRKLVSSESGVRFQHYSRGDVDDYRRIINASGRIAEIPLTISDQPVLTLSELSEIIKNMKKQSGLAVVVIDSVQNIVDEESRDNVEPDIISSRLKVIARQLHVSIIVTINISTSLTQQSHQSPSLSNLGNWKALTDHADAVLFICGQEVDNMEASKERLADVVIAKNVHGDTGSIRLKYKPSISRFENTFET